MKAIVTMLDEIWIITIRKGYFICRTKDRSKQMVISIEDVYGKPRKEITRCAISDLMNYVQDPLKFVV